MCGVLITYQMPLLDIQDTGTISATLQLGLRF